MAVIHRERPRRPAGLKQKTPLNFYSSADPKTGSPFAAKKKRGSFRKLLIRLTDVIILSLVILGLIYSLMVRSDSSLNSAEYYHRSSVYKIQADEQLKKIKNRSKISIDQQEIIKTLISKYPEIASGSVEIPIFSQKPNINLDISAPAFYLNSHGKNYIVNQQGVVVGEASDFPSIKSLITVIDQSGFSPQTGRQAISNKGAAFITQLIAQSAKAKVSIKSIILPAKAQELDLQTADRGYYIKFVLNVDPAQQIGQFLAARRQFDESTNQPVEYLDVRVLGKIFYK